MNICNSGMISGIVVRVEQVAGGSPRAIVTIAGETHREGKPLVFFEQVRLKDRAALAALQLNAGEAVLFDLACVEQLIWNDPVTQDPRAQIVIRALGFARLGQVETKQVGDQRVMLGAINSFTLRGRPVKDGLIKETRSGSVAELNLAIPLGEDQARTHYFQVEAWHSISQRIAAARKGGLVICEVLVKTDSSSISGEKRYFTKLEARTAVCLQVASR